MAIIALEGMRFYANHGYYEEERILGNEFILDVFVNANTMLAAVADELYTPPVGDGKVRPTTVNYETIFLICQAEMRKPAKLLETVVERIAGRIMEHFENAEGVIVRVKKLHPPLAGRVDCSWVLASHGDIEIPSMG